MSSESVVFQVPTLHQNNGIADFWMKERHLNSKKKKNYLLIHLPQGFPN